MATSALPPPTFDPLGPATPQKRASSMPLAAWAALALAAGLATFFLLRRPPETAPVALSPVIVASNTPAVSEGPAPTETETETETEPEPEETEGAAEMVSAMATAMRPTMRTWNMRPRAEPDPEPVAEPTPPVMRETPMMSAPMNTAMGDLPESPTRAEVQAALLAVRGQVRECMSRGGRVPVRVTVSGRTGRVMTATVQDAYFARQPTGGCIARAVRRARFSPFQRERLVIVYPYEF